MVRSFESSHPDQSKPFQFFPALSRQRLGSTRNVRTLPVLGRIGGVFSHLSPTLALVAAMAVTPVAAYCVPDPGPVCQVGQPCPPPAPTYSEEDRAVYDVLAIAASDRPSHGTVTAAQASDYAMRVVKMRRTLFPVLMPADAPQLRPDEEPVYMGMMMGMTRGAVVGATWTWFSPASFAAKTHAAAMQAMVARKAMITPPGC